MGIADSKNTKAELRAAEVMAIAEAVRDPTMLVFCVMALENVIDGKITLDKVFTDDKDAYPPAHTGSSAELNTLFMTKNEDEVYALLKRNPLLKKQIKNQIRTYYNHRSIEGFPRLELETRVDEEKGKPKLYAIVPDGTDKNVPVETVKGAITHMVNELAPPDADLRYEQ